ncbi:MAG: hypothetical protein IPI91_14330 [Flavobacteriales bacterium]|nr:hypothetical protein [Flavobacteriales bacterium]MBK7297720.1 hypothetical protein [Flavobacteriales bacterium]
MKKLVRILQEQAEQCIKRALCSSQYNTWAQQHVIPISWISERKPHPITIK